MNLQTFQQLPVRDQLRSLHAQMRQSTPAMVFGNVEAQIDDVRRRLVKSYHPDAHMGDKEVYGLAEDFIADLNAKYELWVEDDSHMLGVGEIASVTLNADGTVTKRLLTGDKDLFDREEAILNRINALPLYEGEAFKYIPRLVESDMDDDGYYHILAYSDDVKGDELISLTTLADIYDRHVPVKAISWIWRRVLAALTIPHAFGYLHGAVVPDNILLKPGGIGGGGQHRGYLIDWTCAVEAGAKFSYMIDRWENFYPTETLLGSTDTVPASDIYMAAKCMLWACQDMPEPMVKYFRACTLADKHARLYKPEQLFALFDRVMYDELGWQREFVPLNITRVDWKWWQ